jgi:hypothetical protein
MKRLFQLRVFSFALVAFSYQTFAQLQDDNSQRSSLARLLQQKDYHQQEAANDQR